MGIEEIEGIGPEHAAKLTEAGVATTAALLERGAQSSGRAALAAATGIDAALILEWVNHADLMRIRGVGSEYSDLLEAAGVDSPPELARRNAANLTNTFQEVIAARPGIVRRAPTEAEVNDWIEQSKALPRVVEHGGGRTGSSDGGAAPAGALDAPPAEAAPPAVPTRDPVSPVTNTVAPSSAAPAPDHGHDHAGGHDHGAADHEHHAASGAASAPPASAPAPAPAPVARGFAATQPPAEMGIWSRIKRVLGLGGESR
jgi:predicted flap endonuclease-1-like 5' DNA nuclease